MIKNVDLLDLEVERGTGFEGVDLLEFYPEPRGAVVVLQQHEQELPVVHVLLPLGLVLFRHFLVMLSLYVLLGRRDALRVLLNDIGELDDILPGLLLFVLQRPP